MSRGDGFTFYVDPYAIAEGSRIYMGLGERDGREYVAVFTAGEDTELDAAQVDALIAALQDCAEVMRGECGDAA